MNENEWVAYVRQLVDDRLDTSSDQLEIFKVRNYLMPTRFVSLVRLANSSLVL